MDKVRIGVIGLGFGRHHVNTFAQMDDVELVAVADRHPNMLEGIEAYAGRRGARAYDDAIEMMARETLDAVSICTSPGGREPLIRYAAEAGLPMVIEKPWATDLAHARRMAEICQVNDATVMIAFSFRFLPAIVRLRQLMEGELGAGLMLNGEYVFEWLPPADSWLWSPNNGNGFINENSCHLFDAVCYLMGKPVSIYAEGDAFMESPSEDAAAITVRFESGAIAALTCGGIGCGAIQDFPRLDVVTRNGQARLRGRHHIWERLAWTTRGEDQVHQQSSLPEVLGQTRYAAALRYFCDCVRVGTRPMPGVEAGVTTVAMAMAVYESVRTGARVVLDL